MGSPSREYDGEEAAVSRMDKNKKIVFV